MHICTVLQLTLKMSLQQTIRTCFVKDSNNILTMCCSSNESLMGLAEFYFNYFEVLRNLESIKVMRIQVCNPWLKAFR